MVLIIILKFTFIRPTPWFKAGLLPISIGVFVNEYDNNLSVFSGIVVPFCARHLCLEIHCENDTLRTK